MKTIKNPTIYFLLALCSLVLLGCSQKADENKSLSEVKAVAEKMDTNQLRSMAMNYKQAIMAKNDEAEKIIGNLKDIPDAEKLGAKMKEIQEELNNINKSVSALKERFEIYYNKLKEKSGDTSGLEI